MPFGNPQREKSFRCRSTHFFAEINIFSFCVGVLKKNANTKDARKQGGKNFLPSATHLSLTNFLTRTILPPSPAARGGYAASDAWDQRCLSPISLCSAARKRFPKAAAFGSLSWFVLSRMRKNEHLCCTDQRAPQVRSMIVRRKSCKKSWQFLLRKAVCVSKEEVAENSAKLPLPVARS